MDAAEVDYEDEGRKLLQAVHLGDRSAPGRYSRLDAIWRHPQTGAILYCGSQQMASGWEGLMSHNISRIVNCQDTDGKNHFEGAPEITYLRFQIGQWRKTPSCVDGGNGTWAFWEPYFTFVTQGLLAGDNILVHCLAGAHRAGTATIAMLMILCQWSDIEATAAAKQLRPAISPIGGFTEVLGKLQQARVGREQSIQIYAAEEPSEEAEGAERG